ncbi:MAG: pyrophosphokinae [Verrucomicrobiota bacterium]|jgi:ppGpp synthetase/RelA/SpoT-type nucleotidyltranferase
MNPQAASDELWKTKPDVIRRFLESRPLYEKLSEEVAFILESGIQKSGIEFAAVTFRAKTLESFCEKVIRKKYADPLKQITDFGGVRVVYLYKSNKEKLEQIVEKEFKVLEKIDTVDSSDPETFGYGALHYLVYLAGGSSGARYDELKNLTCEIQVRTILQDGWAIIAHHLSYKQEADVPPELRRKLNALSGLFETADDQFDKVRDDRVKYAQRLKEEISTDTKEFLDSPLNLDNLTEYLSWKLPQRKLDRRASIAELLEELRLYDLESLRQVDSVISRAEKALIAYEKAHPPVVDKGKAPQFSSVGVVRVSFELAHEKAREKLDQRRLKFLEEFTGLIDKLPSKSR